MNIIKQKQKSGNAFNQIFSFLMAVALALVTAGFPVFAIYDTSSFQDNDNTNLMYTIIKDTKGNDTHYVSVKKSNEHNFIATKLEIPIIATNKSDGKTYIVTQIDAGAFEGCTSLETLKIPSSITSIGNNAFKDCTGLKYAMILCENITSGNIGTGIFTNTPLESNEGNPMIYSTLKLFTLFYNVGPANIGIDAHVSVRGLSNLNGKITLPNLLTAVPGIDTSTSDPDKTGKLQIAYGGEESGNYYALCFSDHECEMNNKIFTDYSVGANFGSGGQTAANTGTFDYMAYAGITYDATHGGIFEDNAARAFGRECYIEGPITETTAGVYQINVTEPLNGEISFGEGSNVSTINGINLAISGETITFKVTPDSKYVLANGSPSAVSNTGGVTLTESTEALNYLFTMPEADVTLSADFSSSNTSDNDNSAPQKTEFLETGDINSAATLIASAVMMGASYIIFKKNKR